MSTIKLKGSSSGEAEVTVAAAAGRSIPGKEELNVAHARRIILSVLIFLSRSLESSTKTTVLIDASN